MGAQLGLALLVRMDKGAFVTRISFLPRRGRDPDIGLHLLLAVHIGLDHRGLVHVVLGDALALEWALAGQPLCPWAAAAPLLLLGTTASSTFLLCLATTCLMLGQVL